MPDISLCSDHEDCKEAECFRRPDGYDDVEFKKWQSWSSFKGTDYCPANYDSYHNRDIDIKIII